MNLMGAKSSQTDPSSMLAGSHEEGTYESAVVPDAGHYIAEENPEAFVRETLRPIGKA